MSDGNDEALPTAEAVKGDVGTQSGDPQTAEERFRQKTDRRSLQHEIDYTNLQGLRAHYEHKKGWSILIGLAILLMLIFQSFLLRNVGLGVWDFSDYRWLLPALLVQNLGQVVALALVVVRNLFPTNNKK